jgi:hypothetical protein
MKNISLFLLISTIFLSGCTEKQASKTVTKSAYFDYSNSDDQFTGGIKMIPITTPKGTFNVWTKRVGNNPYYFMADQAEHTNFLNVLMAIFQMKKSNTSIMTNWIPITAINQMIQHYGQQRILWKKSNKCVKL